MSYTVRKAIPGEEEETAKLNIRTWQAAYRGIVDEAFLDALGSQTEKRTARFRREIQDGRVFVAAEKGKLIGFASCGAARDKEFEGLGELYGLYVMPENQHAGVGRALVDAVRGELFRLGYNRFIISCLSENSAVGFYRRMGGKPVRETTCPIGSCAYRLTVFEFTAH